MEPCECISGTHARAGISVVERCDNCERFATDAEAQHFIVRAVNAHDDLVAALKKAEFSARMIRVVAGIGNKTKSQQIEWYERRLAHLGDELRAALAKGGAK